jgi:DNA (cytosine-5)-methyltransferase 1
METETTRRLVADDGFAGAGGWDVACNWLDVHARGIENMLAARATRDAAGLTTIHDDVWTFEPDGKAEGRIDSPPCQTFSTGGKGAGRKALNAVLTLARSLDVYRMDRLRERGRDLTPPLPNGEPDERTALVLTPLHFALTNPAYRWLAWEQVPAVLPVWQACAERLRAHGWSVWTGVLNAEQYGVPQTRKRAVLIASRDHEVTPPTPTHSRFYSRTPERLDEGVAKWVSMAEALAPLGWPEAFRVVSNYGTGGDTTKRGLRTSDQPAATVTSKVDRNRVEFPEYMGDVRSSRGCVRPTDHPAPTITGAMDNGNFRWTDRPKAMAPAGTSSTVVDPRPVDHPAATITGAGNAEWGERLSRAAGPRDRDPKGVRVTVAEAGVLQTFPADHPWQGTKSQQYLQAGNAIPPLLAMAVLSAALGEPYVPPNLTPENVPAQPALAN